MCAWRASVPERDVREAAEARKPPLVRFGTLHLLAKKWDPAGIPFQDARKKVTPRDSNYLSNVMGCGSTCSR